MKTKAAPRLVITRFVARRTLRTATVWGYVFGAYMASKTVGYAKAYPTAEARAKIAHSFANNVGLEALLGQPHKIETMAGYAAWNTLSVLTIIGSIWAFLLATKYFRGEEGAGRTELLLAGRTSPRRAAASSLGGLGISLVILYLITAVCFAAVGHLHTIGFSVGNALYFALASTAGAGLFMAIGALSSQIFPTRSRASSAAAIVFGLSFLLRAMGDITTQHWLLNVTPLGWIEKLQPLVGSRPIWLLPIVVTIGVCVTLTIWLAGRRDLGESLVADRDTQLPRLHWLGSPFAAAVRMNRTNALSWLAGVTLISLFYGFLTKPAVQAFNSTSGAQKAIDKLAHAGQGSLASLYMGVVFLILMTLVMSYAANAASHIREDEADGYLDNFLVRPVSRWRWLAGRVALAAGVAAVACLIASLAVWVSARHQLSGIGGHDLFMAGLNMLSPVLFTLGAGIVAMGLWPRATAFAAYGILGWSFLLSMISSGVNLNHWILDTSLLHQVALAPASPPNWHTNFVILWLAAVLVVLGLWLFNRRDLQTE